MTHKKPKRLDNLSSVQRSMCMASIKSSDTQPELIVRRLLHSFGYRYRLHRRDLPGTPDLVLPRYQCVIFVHGCFWHKHRCKRGRSTPRTNAEFWRGKRENTRLRDHRNVDALRRAGWRVIIVWECEVSNPDNLEKRLNSLIPGE